MASIYRVQLEKQSWTSLGGEADEEHEYAEPINPQTEAIEACGVYLQDATHRDGNDLLARGPSGGVWLSNPGTFVVRNAGNTGNIQIFGLDVSDNVMLGSTGNPTQIRIGSWVGFESGAGIDLPNNAGARFTIEGIAVSANVCATGMNVLMGGTGSIANAWHTHSSIVAVAPTCPTFRADGYFRVATGIDVFESMTAFSIASVIVRREIAGTSGQTVVDILKNGTTIFTTPANRPAILYSAGNAARVTAVPDVVLVAQGDRLEMQLVGVEGGNPQDLVAFLQVA